MERRRIEVFGVRLPVAVITAVLLILAYVFGIIPMLLLLIIGAIFKVSDEALTKNFTKIGIVFFADVLFDSVLLSFIRSITVTPFVKLGETIHSASAVLFKISNFIGRVWNFVGDIEDLLLAIIFIIAAISLIKRDEVVIPFTEGIADKIIGKASKEAE